METNKTDGEPQKSEVNQKQTKTVVEQMEENKKYTSGDLWLYGGIGSVITGIIGYFIGQSQGKKKAEKEYEKTLSEWREKMEIRKADEADEAELNGRKEKKPKQRPVFRLE